MKRIRVLLAGFGPFPGAPANPTGALVERLSRARRPALHDVDIATHVFETSYAAVDRELPKLLKRHKPDVMLMFGLAARTSYIRIETRARNAIAAYRDAASAVPKARSIARGKPDLRLPFRPSALSFLVQRSRGRVRYSRDAGAYLCNYLCWRAAAANRKGGPRIAAFVHVPGLAAPSARPARQMRLDDAVEAASAVLAALVADARRT